MHFCGPKCLPFYSLRPQCTPCSIHPSIQPTEVLDTCFKPRCADITLLFPMRVPSFFPTLLLCLFSCLFVLCVHGSAFGIVGMILLSGAYHWRKTCFRHTPSLRFEHYPTLTINLTPHQKHTSMAEAMQTSIHTRSPCPA